MPVRSAVVARQCERGSGLQWDGAVRAVLRRFNAAAVGRAACSKLNNTECLDGPMRYISPTVKNPRYLHVLKYNILKRREAIHCPPHPHTVRTAPTAAPAPQHHRCHASLPPALSQHTFNTHGYVRHSGEPHGGLISSVNRSARHRRHDVGPLYAIGRSPRVKTLCLARRTPCRCLRGHLPRYDAID